MNPQVIKRESFINFNTIISSTMGNEQNLEKMNLDGRYRAMTIDEYWAGVSNAVDIFKARYCPNGSFEKLGQTEECLTFQEFDSYADSRYSKKRKARLDVHIVDCEDCTEVMKKLKNYVTTHPFKFLVRRTISLPYRFLDYLNEKKRNRASNSG